MQLFVNNWVATLLASAPADALTLSVDPDEAAELVDVGGGDYYLITAAQLNGAGAEVAWEIMKVTAKAAGVLTVERAQEGTAALAWPSGTKISARLTAGSMVDDDVEGPDESLDGEVALFSGTTGKLLKRGVFGDLVLATIAAGLSFVDATAALTTDTVNVVLGKLQAQITKYRKEVYGAACSDLTTSIVAGVFKGYVDLPYALTVTEVYCTLATPQASGSLFTVDVNADGTSILGTKLTVDNAEVSSKSAATPATLTTTALAAGTRISFDVDQVGASSVAKGLVCYIVGYPT